jgi:cytochrome c oxidase subunit 2
MMKFAIIFALLLLTTAFAVYTLFPEAFRRGGSGAGQRFWGVLFGVTLALELLLFVVAPMVGWWLPKAVSTFSGDVDLLFYVILAVTGITFIGVSIVFTYILFRFPTEPGRKAWYSHGNHKLEMIWTAIPAVLLLVLAFGQIPAWFKVKNMEWLKNVLASEGGADAEFVQFEVTGRQWEWRIRYPSLAHMNEWKQRSSVVQDIRMKLPPRPDDVRLVNEIHVVKGQKALVHLRTTDVIHSFFLPQMRLKQDALPGKTIPVWFEATEANCIKRDGVWVDGYRFDGGKKDWIKDGNYVWELACAEFCGARHSLMRGKVFVHETRADFEDWLKSAELTMSKNTADGPPPAKK